MATMGIKINSTNIVMSVSGSAGSGSVTIGGTVYEYRSGAQYTIHGNAKLVAISFNPNDTATGMNYRMNNGPLTIAEHGRNRTLSMNEDDFADVFDSIFGYGEYRMKKRELEEMTGNRPMFLRTRKGGARRKTRRARSVKKRRSVKRTAHRRRHR
jgi:hypothetical protein